MKKFFALLLVGCLVGCATHEPKFSDVPDEWFTPWTPTVPKTNAVKRAIAMLPPMPVVSVERMQAARATTLPTFVRAGAPAPMLLTAAAQPPRSVTLAWDASPDPSVTGYRVYFGVRSGTYTNSAAVGKVLTATLTNLTAGVTYYFAATAYDSSGTESTFSNEALYSVPPAVVTYYALNRAETVYYWQWPGPPATLQRSTNLVPVMITVTNISGGVTNKITKVATNWFDVGPIGTNQKVPQTNDYSLSVEFYRVKVTQ